MIDKEGIFADIKSYRIIAVLVGAMSISIGMKKIAVLAVVCLFALIGSESTSLAQGNLSDRCGTPLVAFEEYDKANGLFPVRCLNDGQVVTLLPDAGWGELSPSGNFITYTHHDSDAETMSLYLYNVNSETTTVLRHGDGHIAMQWMPTDKLVISAWPKPVSNAYNPLNEPPYYRALYDAVTDSISQLIWPPDIRGIDYVPQEDRFLLRNSAFGFFSIGPNGLLQPIELPYMSSGSALHELDVSWDGSLVVNETRCPSTKSSSCFAVYNMKTGDVQLITVFHQLGYYAIGNVWLSPTERFVAFDLDQGRIGIYDLEEQRVVFTEEEALTNGYQWAHDEDVLLMAISQEPSRGVGVDSLLYSLDPTTGELELLYSKPVVWAGFY